MAKASNLLQMKAKELYLKGKKLVDIAQEIGVPVGTIRSWKSRQNWDNATLQSEGKARNVARVTKKNEDPDGTKALMQNPNLTEKQKLFCLYYSKSFNAAQSYAKAFGCKYNSAVSNGSALLAEPKIRAEIDRLQEIKRQQIVAKEDDMVEFHMRVAFADIGDYVEFGREKIVAKNKQVYEINTVKLKESSEVDTQLVKEITEGKNGISIKLLDRCKSLEWLDKYFLMNPIDKHKIDYDNMVLELQQKKSEKDIIENIAKYNGIPANMIAPAFIKTYFDICEHEHNEYVFPGGRGSTKSSFISLVIIDLLEKNPDMHAAVYRQVGDTLRDSVYAQMCWAVQALGLEDEYKCTVSPMEITKKSTGQKIFFRGCDDPYKSKGIKAPFGYIGILWLEELDQYKGPEAVRTVKQSVIRGGDNCYIFESFNPPKSSSNWANKYIKIPKQDMLVTESTYLDVPEKWLGKVFLDEAEFLKNTNPTAYENEYMGVANGSGGNIFDNVEIRQITDAEIGRFDRVYRGVDWGWYPDPYHYGAMHYDAARLTLYIFDEYRCNKKSNRDTADVLLKEKHLSPNDKITCDSAEQKSIGDYKSYGLFARGAIKGSGSVEYGMKWLQSLNKIVIDNSRCPNTAEEFLNYEYERDKEGNVISGYPDANNHSIDMVRYAMEEVWRRKGQ